MHLNSYAKEKNTVLAEDRMVESTKTEEGYARPTGQTTLWSTPQALMRSHVTYTLTSFETQVDAVVSYPFAIFDNVAIAKFK